MNSKKTHFTFVVLIFCSCLFSNQLNLSYQLKYAEGQGGSQNYFENYFDINYFFDNGLYLFSQLEYSSPTLIGAETENLSDMMNVFYIEYSNSLYDLTLGNLNLLYGRGLSMHTYQDRGIDYDNTLTGIDATN